MAKRDYRDIAGGVALVLMGAFAAIHSIMSLRLGDLSHMGPGMFPAALGVILATLGLIILAPAMIRSAKVPDVDIRSFVIICASIMVFVVLVEPFGLVPSIIALTLVASRADSKLSLIGTCILAVGLALVATVVFRIGLGMQVPAFDWPW